MPPSPSAPLLYRRLADDMADLVDRRVLRPGERLPSVRSISRQRRVSLATVLRAYQVLEDRGYVEVRPQSGHYVKADLPALPPPPAIGRVRLAEEAVRSENLLGELLERVNDPAIVPFGAATAATELFPVAKLSRLLAIRARKSGGVAYEGPRGMEPLRRQVIRRAAANGVTLHEDELVVTNGCTEALHLALRSATRPGDTILLESPTYYGFLELANSLSLRVLELPTSPTSGVAPDDIRRALRRRRVAAFLTSPNFQNPLGFTVPDHAKREIVDLLAPRGIRIVEDDVYSDLYFGRERPLPYKAFDKVGNVLLCSSISKTVAPGYRVGWVAAGTCASRIASLKVGLSLQTNTLAQLTAADFLSLGGVEHHLRRLRQAFRRQVGDMQHAVARYFPEGTRVSRPAGGHLIWVELPSRTDAFEVARRAFKQRIGVLPGRFFSTGPSYEHCMRINCGAPLTPEREEAVKTLGKLARKA